MSLFPRGHYTSKAWSHVVRSMGLLAALVWVGWAQTAPVFAESAKASISMSSVVGFNGYYGKQHWIPVNITLHNNTNHDVDGDLQLDVNLPLENGPTADGTMHWHEHVKAKADKPVQIAVPGPIVDNDAVVRFVVNGQNVSEAHLTGTALGNAALVAVLSNKSQTAQFLTGSSNGPKGVPVLPETLNWDSLPVDANLYGELTAVAATPSTLAGLGERQSSALETWVRLGGLLIVMGTGTTSKTWVPSLPLESGPAQNVSGKGLAIFVGDSVTPPAAVKCEAKGIRQGGVLWAGTSSQPFIASMGVGRGTVVQTAFSPLDQNLLGWSSNATMWTTVLDQGNARGQSALTGLLDNSQALSLASASNALSPLRIPSLQFWATVFAVYAFCLGPILFYVLRKTKSEPLGWVLLPAISLVTTVAIYTFGATQRPSGVLTEGVGVLDLVGDGTAESYGIRAFMSPAITNATATTTQPMLLMPLSEQNVRPLGTADVRGYGQTTVTFEDVGRWGVRYVYAAGAIENQGKLDVNLQSASDTLSGGVKNATFYNFHNVALCWHERLYEIGDMKPGDSVTVNQSTPSVSVSGGYLSGYGSYNRDITRGIGRPLGTAAEGLLALPMDNEKVMVVATTTDPSPSLPDIHTGQKVDSDHTLVLVRQFANVDMSPFGPGGSML